MTAPTAVTALAAPAGAAVTGRVQLRATPTARPAPHGLSGRGPVDPAPVPSTGPQTTGPQSTGPVVVLPWPEFMAPHVRARHTDTARPVPARGLSLPGGCLLVADVGRVFWSCWPEPEWPDEQDTQSTTVAGAVALGALLVPARMAARLAHEACPDLLIGPGVYAVRRGAPGPA